jgi:hypothetical protein
MILTTETAPIVLAVTALLVLTAVVAGLFGKRKTA